MRIEGLRTVVYEYPTQRPIGEDLLFEHAVDQPSSDSLSGNYRRAPDSGISEPSIPVRD